MGKLREMRVGVTGFEPATSWSRTKRSSQAEPHPESRQYLTEIPENGKGEPVELAAQAHKPTSQKHRDGTGSRRARRSTMIDLTQADPTGFAPARSKKPLAWP